MLNKGKCLVQDTANSLLINGYPNALAAYRDLVSQNRSSILLEAEGGAGIRERSNSEIETSSTPRRAQKRASSI